MKALFIFLAGTFSSMPMAYACPDLRGLYLCQQNSYHADTLYQFEQQQVEGIWNFRMTATRLDRTPLAGFQFKADQVEREVRDEVSGAPLLMKAFCQDHQLFVEGTARTEKGTSVRFREVLAQTAEGHLSNTSLNMNGDMVQEICQRQN